MSQTSRVSWVSVFILVAAGACGFLVGRWVYKGSASRPIISATESDDHRTGPVVPRPDAPAIFEPKWVPVAPVDPSVSNRIARDALAAKLDQIRRGGEFVLDSEYPDYWEHTSEFRRRAVAQFRPEEEARFREFCAGSGLDSNQVQKLLDHQLRIRDAGIQVSLALNQFKEGQYDYDKRIRALLGEERYAEYRDLDRRNYAEREWAELVDWTRQVNSPVDENFGEVIKGLIAQERAYVNEYTGGPYDSEAKVAVGQEPVAQAAEAAAEELGRKSSILLERAAEVGVPAQTLDTLTQYYQARVLGGRRIAEAVRQPVVVPRAPE